MRGNKDKKGTKEVNFDIFGAVGESPFLGGNDQNI
jgi:hypothetical protein